MSKLLTVFGASGNQGGSVIRAVLANPVLSKEFHIRAITRDTSKPSITQMAEKGVDTMAVGTASFSPDTTSQKLANKVVEKADMASAESLADAVNGAHTVFLMTNF